MDWYYCVRTGTDNARAIRRKYSDLVTRIQSIALQAICTQRSLHWKALAVKWMPVELKKVTDEAAEVENFIKSPMNASSLFDAI